MITVLSLVTVEMSKMVLGRYQKSWMGVSYSNEDYPSVRRLDMSCYNSSFSTTQSLFSIVSPDLTCLEELAFILHTGNAAVLWILFLDLLL